MHADIIQENNLRQTK